MKLIRKKPTSLKVGLHPVTVMRKANDPEDDFPASIPLSSNVVCFDEDEIDAWIKRRKDARPVKKSSDAAA